MDYLQHASFCLRIVHRVKWFKRLFDGMGFCLADNPSFNIRRRLG